jgi:hypothetical protein
MNTIRSAMSVFLLTVLVVAVLGWKWTAGLPSPRLEAARVMLGLCALFAAGGLGILWSARSSRVP